MENKVSFTLSGFEDYRYWENEDKKALKKINALIVDIQRNGNSGLGKPEPLKEKYSGFYSRRIDEKNRLIYRIESDTLIIISCRNHYEDK